MFTALLPKKTAVERTHETMESVQEVEAASPMEADLIRDEAVAHAIAHEQRAEDAGSDYQESYDEQELEQQDPDLTPTTVLEVEHNQTAALEAIPGSLFTSDRQAMEGEPVKFEHVEFTGADYFDGHGIRKMAYREDEPLLVEQVAAEPLEDAQVEMQSADAAPRTPWLVTAAMKGEEIRQSLAAGFAKRREGFAARWTHLRGHDASWLRAAPVAAIITIAFLLGWGASGVNRNEPSPQAVPLSDSKTEQASVIPTPEVAKQVVSKPAASKPTPAKRPARKVQFDEDEYVGEDVVIRHYPKHYPSKGVQAANQKGTVKRFSDIE